MAENLRISLTPFQAISLRDWLLVTGERLGDNKEVEALQESMIEFVSQVQEQLTPEMQADAEAEIFMNRLLGKEPG